MIIMVDIVLVVVFKSFKKKVVVKLKKLVEYFKYIDMVLDVIKNLKERKGFFCQVILKYVMSKFKVGNDVIKVNFRIKVVLKNGVKSKVLKQSKGVGVQGRFSVGEKKVVVKKFKVVKLKVVVKKFKVKKFKVVKKLVGEKVKKVKKFLVKVKLLKKVVKFKVVKKFFKKFKVVKFKKVKLFKKVVKFKKVKIFKKGVLKK